MQKFFITSEFKKYLDVSAHTLALCIVMSVTDTSQKAIADLGKDEINFIGSVFAWDTLYAESEVHSKRESASRPGVSIVTKGLNQDRVMVCTFKRNMFIPAAGHVVEHKVWALLTISE
jgi:itaconyl-CoA hydratase